MPHEDAVNVAEAGLTAAIGIGGMMVRLDTSDTAFLRMVEQR